MGSTKGAFIGQRKSQSPIVFNEAYLPSRFLYYFAGMEAAVLVYIVEITESPKHRAILLSLMSPVTGFGTIISHLLGHFLFWRNAAIVLSFFSAFCCALIFVIPESPVWLLSRNDIRGAEKSLEWLQTGNQNIKDELKEIQKNKISHPKARVKEASLLKRIHVTKAWKPFLILTSFFVLQQCAGYTIVLYYAVNFYELFDTPIDGFVSSIVFTSLGFLTSVLLTCIIDKFSRKTITVISAAGVGVTCTIAAGYQYLYGNENERPVFWLPLGCMWIDVIFCCLGIKTLPWTMIGELFPREVRDFMSGLQLTVAYLILFMAVKLYPLTVSLIKIHGVLTMFSISGFATVLFAIFILPETRGKTLAEIEKYWVS